MAHRFKVGDKVRVIKTAKLQEKYLGLTVVIKSEAGYISEYVKQDMCYFCDGLPNLMYAEDSALELLYDGNEKTSWENCEWKPEFLTTKEAK